jgi:hypothetical protein
MPCVEIEPGTPAIKCLCPALDREINKFSCTFITIGGSLWEVQHRSATKVSESAQHDPPALPESVS